MRSVALTRLQRRVAGAMVVNINGASFLTLVIEMHN